MHSIEIALILFVLVLSYALPTMAADPQKEHAAITAALQKEQEHVSVWQRYPLVGLPLVVTAPTIDGKVEVREWFQAARLSRFTDYNKGLAVRDKTDLYLAYSATHLYMAFQFERPDGARTPTDKDFLEIQFDPSHKHGRYYDVGFGLEKVLWDGIGPNTDKKAWEPTWDYKGRATHTGWEGEIAIAWKEFGLDGAPAPGTVWGADFTRNEHTPVDRLALWAFRGKNWHATKNFGHLLFTGKPLAIRVEGLGWIPDTQQAGVKLFISNFGKEPVTLDTTLELRKAAGPVTMEYYPRIDSAMAEDLPAAIGSPLQAEVTSALRDYQVLKNDNRKITIAPDASELIQLTDADAPGKYLAGFAVKEGETLLAGSLLPAEISVPLAIKLSSYLYSAHTLEYEVDLRRVQDKLGDNAKLTLAAQGPDGKVLAQQDKPITPGATEVAGVLKFAPLSDATINVIANVTNTTGSVAKNQEPLHIPAKPVWLDNTIGEKKFVPEPFKPVQASDKQCAASTMVYSWQANNVMPNIKVNGNDILAAPLVFSFKDAGGGVLPLKLNAWKLKSSDIERAEYSFSGDLAGKANVTGTVAIEFDGLAWYRLNIAPKEKLDLSVAKLEFILKKEYARYCTVGAAEDGTVYSGHVPAEGIHSRFSFAYWLGGIEGGVQWFAENPKNWFNQNAKDVAQITSDDKVGRIAINFIDKAVSLDKPIDWSFGLIATPSRVKPKDWGEYSYFQTSYVDESNFAPLPADADWEQRARWNYYNKGGWQRDKDAIYAYIHHGGWQEIFGYPGSYEAKRQREMKSSVKYLHNNNIKTIVYAGWGAATDAPEWRDFGMEMVRLPLYNSGYGTFRQEPASLWQDWFIFKTAEMIKDYEIDGLFIDSVTSPVIAENYIDGMRWTDENGKVRGSYPILATRAWLKRLYKMFHGEIKNGGIIYNHNSPPAVMAIETFADVRCPSEFAQTHPGEFDQTFLDFFIAKNSGEPFGLFTELTNKDWMGQWAVKKTPQVYALALPLNLSIKAVNQHSDLREWGDYKTTTQMMPWIWHANKWADRSTAEYLPWWKNAKYITATPNDNQVIHALWLHKGEKALLCVSNLKNAARKIDVTLNLKELGMNAIAAQDAITGETVSTQDGKLSLDVDFERFRLLKITKAR